MIGLNRIKYTVSSFSLFALSISFSGSVIGCECFVNEPKRWKFSGSAFAITSNGSLPSNVFLGDFSASRISGPYRTTLSAGAYKISELVLTDADGQEQLASENTDDDLSGYRLNTKNISGRQFSSLEIERKLTGSVFGTLIVGNERNKRAGIALHKYYLAGIGIKDISFGNDNMMIYAAIGNRNTETYFDSKKTNEQIFRFSVRYRHHFSDNTDLSLKYTVDRGEKFTNDEFDASLDFWFAKYLGLRFTHNIIDYDSSIARTAFTGTDADSITGASLLFRYSHE